MKKCILSFLCFFFFVANFSFVTAEPVKIERRKANRKRISTKSLTYIPVDVDYENSCLSIHFSMSIGEARIIIENHIGGIEYNTTIDTEMENCHMIDLTELDAGDYLLIIEYDEYALLGNFTIDENISQ